MIDFTRINNDVNGNPRYVCHYLNLLTKYEQSRSMWEEDGRRITPTRYEIAVKRANTIGGRKYHTKSYGGGVVFQSYSLKKLENSINEAVRKATEAEQAEQEREA